MTQNKSGIAIAGTGNIAQSLGRLLRDGGADVVQVIGRDPDRARKAAAFIGAGVAAGTFAELACRVNRIIVAVADHALPEVVQAIVLAGFSGGLALHTSGGSGLDTLKPLAERGTQTGIIHPLQSVPSPDDGMNSLPGSFFAVAGDEAAISWAKTLVGVLEGRLIRVDADGWALYHAGAVMASNYQVTLIDSALELFAGAGVSREIAMEALASIVRATNENIFARGPESALTGPIQRADVETVKRHVRALASATPETRRAYVALGLRTLPIAVRRGSTGPESRSIQGVFETAINEVAK